MVKYTFPVSVNSTIRNKQRPLVSSIVGQLRRNGVSEEEITDFTEEALDGDLEATWYTIHKYVKVIEG